LNWRVGKIGETDHRSCLYDANFWKSFAAARLRLAVGDPEALVFHAGEHDLLFEHLTAEYPVRTEARGRVVDEWKQAGRDNHWLDCLVGASVAASVTGLQPTASETPGGRARKKVAVPVTMGGSIKVQPLKR
jgi:phage terminase large subunit GpA-like protein